MRRLETVRDVTEDERLEDIDDIGRWRHQRET